MGNAKLCRRGGQAYYLSSGGGRASSGRTGTRKLALTRASDPNEPTRQAPDAKRPMRQGWADLHLSILYTLVMVDRNLPLYSQTLLAHLLLTRLSAQALPL